MTITGAARRLLPGKAVHATMTTLGDRHPSATDLLYQRDAYLQEFEATVSAVDAERGAVALSATAFYPGGGGQPCDTGSLSTSDGAETWNVMSLERAGASPWHLLQPAARLPVVGETLRGRVDWPSRLRLMRTHTAMHALCGTIFRDYGALVTGGNMGLERARMDFEMEEFTADRVAEIERTVNDGLARERDVRVRIVPRDEAFRIPDLIRTKINLLPEGIPEIRIVEIVGLDLQADGGTHVANTREVGGIKIVGTRSKGRINKRLEIVLTGREGDAVAEGA